MKCALCVVLFWAMAAALVLAVPYDAVKGGLIVIAAFAYMRTMRGATIDHALLVGAAWVVLAIVAEVFQASRSGSGWFNLVGSPAHPNARVMLLIAWVGAPSLFVRTRS